MSEPRKATEAKQRRARAAFCPRIKATLKKNNIKTTQEFSRKPKSFVQHNSGQVNCYAADCTKLGKRSETKWSGAFTGGLAITLQSNVIAVRENSN